MAKKPENTITYLNCKHEVRIIKYVHIKRNHCEVSFFFLQPQNEDDERPVVVSTKRPTNSVRSRNKRSKTQAEDVLISRALEVMEKRDATAPPQASDSFDTFGRYVASELRSMANSSQHWVKWQIHKIIFEAQSSHSLQYILI